MVRFQHTAARRRLPLDDNQSTEPIKFQHTAARRRLPFTNLLDTRKFAFQHTAARRRLLILPSYLTPRRRFNTQPPEGGCVVPGVAIAYALVSTHSRPKAAATDLAERAETKAVSTHSRPKAAALNQICPALAFSVSTHSRPKAAARYFANHFIARYVSTHSRPKAAARAPHWRRQFGWFQHTAARRRLPTPLRKATR